MPWIDLADVKLHLNKGPATSDDVELDGFITAACNVVESLIGHVDQVVYEADLTTRSFLHNHGARYHTRRHILELVEYPVMQVDSVALLAGNGTTAEVVYGDPDSGTIGYSLIDNVLTVPQYGTYRVTYRAGLYQVPGNVRLAALDLVAHLWRGSQLNSGGGRPRLGATGDYEQMIVPGVASALPYRVRELLGIFGDVIPAPVVIG